MPGLASRVRVASPRRVVVVSEAVAATCASRAEAELLVAVLADAGVPGVVFADVTRGPHAEVLGESAEVRILATDVARARSAIAAWREARAAGIDEAELERQALEAGGTVGVDDRRADELEGGVPRGEGRARAADRSVPRAAVARASGTVCPHCAAPVPEGFGRRVRRAFAALSGRSGAGGGERLCTACGHRWDPSA